MLYVWPLPAVILSHNVPPVLAATPSTERFNDGLISPQKIVSACLMEENPGAGKPST